MAANRADESVGTRSSRTAHAALLPSCFPKDFEKSLKDPKKLGLGKSKEVLLSSMKCVSQRDVEVKEPTDCIRSTE